MIPKTIKELEVLRLPDTSTKIPMKFNKFVRLNDVETLIKSKIEELEKVKKIQINKYNIFNINLNERIEVLQSLLGGDKKD